MNFDSVIPNPIGQLNQSLSNVERMVPEYTADSILTGFSEDTFQTVLWCLGV